MPDITPEWERDSNGYFTTGSAVINENNQAGYSVYHVWSGVTYVYALKFRNEARQYTNYTVMAHSTTGWNEIYTYNYPDAPSQTNTVPRSAGDYSSSFSIYDRNVNTFFIPAMPVFEYDDTESINKYINNGDISGAINADDFAEKLYANWVVAFTNAENTNYSIAVDCPQFYDSNSEFYGKSNLASVHIEAKQAGEVGDTVYNNSIPYGTTWNATLQSLYYNSNSNIGEKLLEKVLSLLDVDHIRFGFWVSFYDSEREAEVTSAHGFVVFDHAQVEDYGFVDEAHGDTITFKAGVVLDDTDSDVSNNDIPDETSDTPDSESVANVTGGNLLTRTYAMTPQEVQGIGAFLWGATFMQDVKLLNSSPIENVVGCKLFPFELGGTDQNVYIGNVDSGTQSKQVDKTVVKFESNLITIPLYYSNVADNLKFLDYAPYTKVEIFLPFIGLKELPTDLCIGKSVKITWLIDLICGTLQTDLYIDGKCTMIFNSQVGVDIPLTAQNLAQVQSAYIQNAIGGGVSLASGNPLGAVSAMVSTATTQYHSQSTGTPSPCTAIQGTFTPYVIITRPDVKTVGDVTHRDNTVSRCLKYKEVMGAPCYMIEPLGNFEGYTEVENPRVSVDGALKVEVEEINRLLDLGVIMPKK